ncbi:MAG TPA: hypothetical protein VF173_14755 [Thermoanaerobaculia bacterium]|nr:hypothetical protein [Thermoanaerobaculia bacterium]
MRKTCLRILVLLAVLASVGVSKARTTTLPFCLFIDQECVRCGPDLAKKCTYYECDDGTQRVTCTQCSLFCTVA